MSNQNNTKLGISDSELKKKPEDNISYRSPYAAFYGSDNINSSHDSIQVSGLEAKSFQNSLQTHYGQYGELPERNQSQFGQYSHNNAQNEQLNQAQFGYNKSQNEKPKQKEQDHKISFSSKENQEKPNSSQLQTHPHNPNEIKTMLAFLASQQNSSNFNLQGNSMAQQNQKEVFEKERNLQLKYIKLVKRNREVLPQFNRFNDTMINISYGLSVITFFLAFFNRIRPIISSPEKKYNFKEGLKFFGVFLLINVTYNTLFTLNNLNGFYNKYKGMKINDIELDIDNKLKESPVLKY